MTDKTDISKIPRMAPDGTGPLRVLRIAHASLTPALRGRERGIAKRFPNIEMRVITPRKWKETGVEIKAVGDEHFPVITARTFLSKHIQLFMYSPFPIIKELRAFKPDVIDMDHEPYSLPCAEIVTLRNLFAPTARIVMQTAQNIFKKYPQPFRALEKRALKAVSAAYMCSETVREVLEGKGFTGPAVVAPFGVDPDLFHLRPKQDKGEERPLVIGYVGRLIEGKGIMTLTAALARLKDKDWRILVVGDGPRSDEARRSLSDNGLLERATFTGAVNYEEIPDYFQMMDLLIVPTRTTPKIREQFGRVIIEAMACGVPVIGSTCGAIPEVIGESGLVFEETDDRDLSEKIKLLLENEKLREQLSAKGVELVGKRFTWAHAAEKIVSAYGLALAENTFGKDLETEQADTLRPMMDLPVTENTVRRFER